jgi:hypothetical protein
MKTILIAFLLLDTCSSFADIEVVNRLPDNALYISGTYKNISAWKDNSKSLNKEIDNFLNNIVKERQEHSNIHRTLTIENKLLGRTGENSNITSDFTKSIRTVEANNGEKLKIVFDVNTMQSKTNNSFTVGINNVKVAKYKYNKPLSKKQNENIFSKISYQDITYTAQLIFTIAVWVAVNFI